MQARTLAMRRQDFSELAEIEVKLKDLPAVQTPRKEELSLADKLAKVNERNRKANLEAVRRAEFEAERKRKERKLAASGLSGTATPDSSAKLKAVSRFPDSISRFVVVHLTFNPWLFYLSAHLMHYLEHLHNMNRSATPNISGTGTPVLQAQSTLTGRPISPFPVSVSALSVSPSKSLEASLIDSIEVDLGDF